MSRWKLLEEYEADCEDREAAWADVSRSPRRNGGDRDRNTAGAASNGGSGKSWQPQSSAYRQAANPEVEMERRMLEWGLSEAL